MSFGASKKHPLSLIGVFRARMRGVDTETLRAEERRRAEAIKMRREHERASRRLVFAIATTVSIYVLIAAKMALLAMTPAIETGSNYQHAAIHNDRADIIDRNGEILATNLPGYSLYAHPHEMVDPEAAATGLSRIFPGLDADALYKRFTREGTKFLWIKQQISPEQRQAVFNLGEPGLLFGSRELRLFPNGAIAAHLLGGVKFGETGVNAAEIKGQAGIEFAFNSYLSDPKNADRPLKLSVDVSVQDALEAVLAQGMVLNRAKGAAAVLLEADTGRVIAMSSLPDYDPNLRPEEIPQGNDPSVTPRFNRAALGIYELGSTFKIFTAALALEKGHANPNTMIEIGSSIQSGRHKIRDFDYYGAELSLHDVVVKSSNIGTARIARNMGAASQREFLSELGFMEPTRLELPEARKGMPLFPKDKNWSEISTMTISYGHGIAASPLHLAAGYATIVNGGYKITPTLLNDIPADMARERVISEETSLHLRKMLRDVVVSKKGTASLARTDGYDIGGKTGTADKLKPEGGYYKDKNINTFAAAFPMSDPKYVLVVTLDEPSNPTGKSNQRTAGWTTVPVAREIVLRVAPLLNLRPVYHPDIPIE